MRTALRQLLKPGQERLHMTQESARRRRQILAWLCDQPLTAVIYRSIYPTHRDGRSAILRSIVRDLDRLTIESAAGQDRHDQRVLQDAVHQARRHDVFHYEHREPRHEPLLWAADAVVFAYAAAVNR